MLKENIINQIMYTHEDESKSLFENIEENDIVTDATYC